MPDEFDTTLDTSPAADPGTAQEPASEPAAEPAAAEPASWSPSSDDWEAVQDEIATLRTQLQQPPAQQQDGQPFDINEYLSPLNENFGVNLAALIAQMNQEQRATLAPLLDQHQAAQQAAQEERIAAPILKADAQTHGEMSADQIGVVQTLANAFLPQHEQRFGAGTDRALQAALGDAVQRVRALTAATRQAGAQETLDQLHTASTQAPAPQAGGQGIAVPVVRIGQRVVDRVA